jgi:hypothetical protein
MLKTAAKKSAPPQQRLWAKVDKQPDGRWVWTGCQDKQGYGFIGIAMRQVRVHRYSWEIHFGPIPVNTCVLHDCDNPSRVNPLHLFLGTRPQNTADMVSKKRQAYGQRNGQARLTEEQVLEIRQRRRTGGVGNNCNALAREFGVSPASITLITKGVNWRHLNV